MHIVDGSEGPDTIGARNGATADADYIYGYGGEDKLYGLGGNDHLVGGDDKDELYGGDGEDYLHGEDGDDWIYGDEGNDWMHGGAGADFFDGGVGDDYVAYHDSPSGVSINLMAGKGSGGDAAGDTFVDVESVDGSKFDDTLFGDNNGNLLSGDNGRDTMKGFGGDDYIYGGDDNDTIFGMDGVDLIHGGAGKDYIVGGAGRDSLFGDDGGDTFVWGSTDDAPVVDGPGYTVCNTDVISDFDVAEGDLIDLHFIDADIYAAGNQAFTFIGASAFSGTPGELAYVHYCDSTFILMQTGTSTDFEGVIRLPGTVIPQAIWFEL
jgi:Ca2+-binding RTX toxin-like protein